jgi:ABC-type nitrate/sulfonate/bicarbonate transport system permease component
MSFAAGRSKGLEDGEAALEIRQTMVQRIIASPWPYRAVVLAIVGIAWQVYATTAGKSILLPTFTGTIAGLGTLLTTPDVYRAFAASNEALAWGFPTAIAMGILTGLAMARFATFERYMDPYLSILLVTPLAAIIPILVMALGFGLLSRVILVVVFTIPVVIVNTRAGVREVDPRLVEMSISFGSSERQIWTRVLLPGALPAIMTGVRLGLGRGVTGMVVLELLLVAVGIGGLLLDYRALFESELLYGVVILVVLEALVLVTVAQVIERRLAPWARNSAITE